LIVIINCQFCCFPKEVQHLGQCGNADVAGLIKSRLHNCTTAQPHSRPMTTS